jgi:hypothetical protein
VPTFNAPFLLEVVPLLTPTTAEASEMQVFFALVLLAFLAVASGLKVGFGVKRGAFAANMEASKNVLASVGVGASAAMIPATAHADSSSAAGAVGIPLAISILVMFPFLYYANALKPKERSVKQIELDEQLRPKKGGSSGPVGQARVGKKK